MSKQTLEMTPGWFDDGAAVRRRVAEVHIAPEHLIALVQGTIVGDPATFPEDAQVVSARWDEKRGSFAVIVRSDQYFETWAGADPYALSLRLKAPTGGQP